MAYKFCIFRIWLKYELVMGQFVTTWEFDVIVASLCVITGSYDVINDDSLYAGLIIIYDSSLCFSNMFNILCHAKDN